MKKQGHSLSLTRCVLVLFAGVSFMFTKRIYEHKNDLVAGFSNKYQTHLLVYYEECQTAEEAILREKRLKKWERKWKLRLIEESNPHWKDLYGDII